MVVVFETKLFHCILKSIKIYEDEPTSGTNHGSFYVFMQSKDSQTMGVKMHIMHRCTQGIPHMSMLI